MAHTILWQEWTQYQGMQYHLSMLEVQGQWIKVLSIENMQGLLRQLLLQMSIQQVIQSLLYTPLSLVTQVLHMK